MSNAIGGTILALLPLEIERRKVSWFAAALNETGDSQRGAAPIQRLTAPSSPQVAEVLPEITFSKNKADY